MVRPLQRRHGRSHLVSEVSAIDKIFASQRDVFDCESQSEVAVEMHRFAITLSGKLHGDIESSN